MDIKTKSNWINPDYVYWKNVQIVEYDIKDGGLSIIKENKLLDQPLIDKLISQEKEIRNINIGKIQAKDKDLSKNMVEGFGDARERFVNNNNIAEVNILSVKKDAIFLINPKNINGIISENIEFRKKETYTSYLYINRKEFLYSAKTKGLTIKGFTQESKEYQKNFLLKDIKKFMRQAESVEPEVLFKSLKTYRENYLNKKLPTETYRNLDTGMYLIDGYEMSECDDSYIDKLDISYNYITYILPIIRELI